MLQGQLFSYCTFYDYMIISDSKYVFSSLYCLIFYRFDPVRKKKKNNKR